MDTSRISKWNTWMKATPFSVKYCWEDGSKKWTLHPPKDWMHVAPFNPCRGYWQDVFVRSSIMCLTVDHRYLKSLWEIGQVLILSSALNLRVIVKMTWFVDYIIWLVICLVCCVKRWESKSLGTLVCECS